MTYNVFGGTLNLAQRHSEYATRYNRQYEDLERSRGTRWRLFVDLVTTFHQRPPSTQCVDHQSVE